MKTSSHIVAFSILQIVIITLFLLFVRYDPTHAQRSKNSVIDGDKQIKDVYPLFQDVHIMIFIGFGFLMTFLKKYGLSAMSLNMLIAVICLQWAPLVYGFFHLHTHNEMTGDEYAIPRIYLNQVESMLYSDFASAAVLIS